MGRQPDSGAYQAVRNLVAELGGRMTYDKSGREWTVRIDSKVGWFQSNDAGFPELDKLYVPRVPHPKHYTDYSFDLVPEARDRLLALLQSF